MPDETIIEDSAVILRRIPPPLDENTKTTPDGLWRPNSQWFQKRKPEDTGISCSQFSITSPQALLDQLKSQGMDTSGWGVCCVSVSAVRGLGLEVVHKPEGEDEGHCEIQGEMKRKTPKKIARLAVMLSPDEIAAGTHPNLD